MTDPTAGAPADPAALRAQCDEARALVAANPADESAAETLFDRVRRAVRELGSEASPGAHRLSPELAQAAGLLERGEAEQAEISLRRHLSRVPNDPDAMLMMADIAAKCGFPEDAERIVRRSVEIHPARPRNWVALAKALHDRATRSDDIALVDESVAALDRALRSDATNEEALAYKAALLVQVRRLEEGQAAFERLVRAHPESPPAWLYLGNLLKTLGRFGEAVAAYRTAIAADPSHAVAWWMLSDLKLARFFPADIARMEDAIGQPLPELSKVALHFALAAAYDQAKDYPRAAQHLREGNALRLRIHPHDIQAMRRGVDAAVRTYTRGFFADRRGAGEHSRAPVFIIGMPRSGSTLLEQILSSHSSIEGTEELFAVQQIEAELFPRDPDGSIDQIVAHLDRTEFQKLGRRYLDLTRHHRKTDRERFTDKHPGNWRQIGLIHTMLPGAKIIDIRRNPLDCCFANYRQHFLFGANYTYGIEEVASQYREYVRLMRHFDGVIPGAIHRVIYEDMIDNPEAEVRRIFDYLELPFEDACLRFYETKRAVHTPSSEQVRQPINRSGVGRWARYEPWLGGLREALGPLLDDWRR